MLSRLAWSCAYYHDVYAGIQYEGQSMLYWCKREVKFGAYWLLRTHVPGAAGRTATWGADDKFVIMVRCLLFASALSIHSSQLSLDGPPLDVTSKNVLIINSANAC
jgi:hypothetical protein